LCMTKLLVRNNDQVKMFCLQAQVKTPLTKLLLLVKEMNIKINRIIFNIQTEVEVKAEEEADVEVICPRQRKIPKKKTINHNLLEEEEARKHQ